MPGSSRVAAAKPPVAPSAGSEVRAPGLPVFALPVMTDDEAAICCLPADYGYWLAVFMILTWYLRLVYNCETVPLFSAGQV